MPFITWITKEVVIYKGKVPSNSQMWSAPFQSGLTATFNIQFKPHKQNQCIILDVQCNKLLKKIPLSNLSLTGLLIVSYKICILKIGISVFMIRNTMVLFLIFPTDD